ncbi:MULTISPECIES: GGDEF domain-containing protein [Comamonas]|nr:MULTISPECIES: GGDEF domain-containing protein [Comamonas]ACY33010.1 diguanylate cyclase [Comamonas thiooxydans]MBL5976229.1 GGDEF domain-containing protein [Comamonas sp. NyZ500]MDO1475275.1 GGDEF domain-containing protein [Comamonas thiooxydans]QOQ80181.1 GGDEF domain-containing protein [Comamonas thiooxydans]UUE94987.1 GGDEF domain-containing protein [Comamonas thiooxydans]
MVATVILGMLCVHLLCFCVLFMLISRRLPGRKMGMEVFALGNLLLGCAYILQLLGGKPGWSVMSLVNHTLTLCAPVAYVLGAMRFFNRPTPVWRPLLILALAYSAAQVLVQSTLGLEARQAMLAAACTLLFLCMTITLLWGTRSFARNMAVEMVVFAILIAGICGLNAMKLMLILKGGLQALDMNSRFQMVFYIYMSFLGTVIPPGAVWLALRRLTDELGSMAAQDPLTKLLNRRGLLDGLEAHFAARKAAPVHLLIVDIDHFKRINDNYGHQFGDNVLCRVAEAIQQSTRRSDLKCRLGGEEFLVLCPGLKGDEVLQLAERIRAAIAEIAIPGISLHGSVTCTATIGVSNPFITSQAFDITLQQADAALYRGKSAGRNRVQRADPEYLLPQALESKARRSSLSNRERA